MAKYNLVVSLATYDEVYNQLEVAGIKLKQGDELVISKDVKLEVPGVNYKQVTIRRDVLSAIAPIYKSPMDRDYEISDSSHFIKFLDDTYNYVLNGNKPQPTPDAIQATKTETPKWK